MIHRDELDGYLKGLLAVDRFKDYGPNGLQVEGRAEVRKVVSGVTASLALIEAAVDAGADAIVVHHGLFWRGQDGRVTGWMKKRLQRLLAADVNLFAYHLPLDAHPELGNNAQLARRLGLTAERSFGDQELGLLGAADAALTLEALAARVRERLGVPVESDQDGPGMCGQHRRGVSGETERGVDVHGRPVGSVQRGGEQLETTLKQHRHVRTAKLPHLDPPVTPDPSGRAGLRCCASYRQIPNRSAPPTVGRVAPGTGEEAPGTSSGWRSRGTSGAGTPPYSPPGSTPSSMSANASSLSAR